MMGKTNKEAALAITVVFSNKKLSLLVLIVSRIILVDRSENSGDSWKNIYRTRWISFTYTLHICWTQIVWLGLTNMETWKLRDYEEEIYILWGNKVWKTKQYLISYLMKSNSS